MKVNHKLIREVLQITGITIFLVSIFFKLRNLLLYGGTRIIEEDENEHEKKDTPRPFRGAVTAVTEAEPDYPDPDNAPCDVSAPSCQ